MSLETVREKLAEHGFGDDAYVDGGDLHGLAREDLIEVLNNIENPERGALS